MLQLRDYTKKEMAKTIGCNEYDVEAIRRKLNAYGVAFTYDRGTQTYTITDTGDLFKQLCVWDYDLPRNIDYEKFALYVFLVFVANKEGIDYNSMPLEEMADTLAVRYPELATSRQTLSKYQEHLDKLGLAICDTGNPNFVLANKTNEGTTYTPIDNKIYSEAWKYYFSQKDMYKRDPEAVDWASTFAYRDMVKKYGGHPKKHYPMVGSAFTKKEAATFIDLATEKVTKSNVST